MEQRELAGSVRSRGGDAEFFIPGSTINRADLMEGVGGRGVSMGGDRLDPEEEDDLGPGRDVDDNSNPDSEKWVQGDGLEEQEFSIKEASFSEGSLKLKIQTTKRAKKPPKSLENYICPPEIRITIKQPSEQKGAKQGKSGKGAKEEEKGPPRKKTYEKCFKPNEQDEGDPMNMLGESMKPKHPPKSTLKHQLHWTKPQAEGSSSQGTTVDSEPRKEPVSINRSSLPDLTSCHTKIQLKKVPESPSLTHFTPGMQSQITSSQIQSSLTTTVPLKMQPDSGLIMVSSLNKERCLQQVTEQVFGNIKRKYGRKDSGRTLVGYGSDHQWNKKPGIDFEPKTQDSAKEKLMTEPEKVTEPTDGESNNSVKNSEGGSEILSGSPPLLVGESKINPGKKARYRRSLKDQMPVQDLTEETVTSEATEKTERGFVEPKAPSKSEPRVAKSVAERRSEVEQMLTETAVDLDVVCRNKLRKNPVGRPRSSVNPSKQEAMKHQKFMGRWSYLKSKTSSHQKDCSGPISAISEPPSAYPITPSSPLYANTDSLTVITPVKKKRGRPKKQPLLTVETIHEGTSTSPVSPIARESSGTVKKRKKRRNLAKLVQMGTINSPPAKQLKLNKKTNYSRVLDKKTIQTVNKMKLVTMQNILNEILSCSKSNLGLKSMTPVSNVVSTMASTIEARLGKQINVSKRGTIYIGKKRGRKPRADMKVQQDEHKTSDKHPVPVSSQFENLIVPSNPPSTAGMPSPRAMQPLSVQAAGACGILCPATADATLSDLKTMPNLQPISALPTKAPNRLQSLNWKLSPPRLMANSPSHLSEVASLKEVTLSPVSESHSEETIPSDSGIGTDNNSTSDQAEKGSASRRRYSFDFCSLEASEVAALEANNKAMRGHCSKHVTTVAVENFLAQESLKKQKHRRKRKGLQSRDDIQFLADLEELIGKFQVFRISHRSYNFYRENSYPSIFRINFDPYYPMSYIPYDPLHYLRRNSEIKSKRRRGRPAKSNEPMTKMPFIQGFGYPIPSGNYYAPYAMPYTSMPIATSMMNLGYYGQYPAPVYLSHSVGSASSPFMRPAVPPSQFHSGAHVKLSASAAKHKTKHGSHQTPSARMDKTEPTLVSLKGGTSSFPSVRLHKRKHKHKHKHKEDQLSNSQREGLGGLFSGGKKPGILSLLSERQEISDKETSITKVNDKQRNQRCTDTLSRSSRSIFEVGTLSALSLSDSLQHKHMRELGEVMGDLSGACSHQHPERLRSNHDLSPELFGAMQSSRAEESNIRGRRRSLESFGIYREQNILPFKDVRRETAQQIFHCPSPTLPEHNPLRKRVKRKEMDEIQYEVRKMCAFSKILSTKKNLDHVNKILKVKRLQRQAKTGNNIVKRRRGRPRKQPQEEEPAGQMPVLERCVDLPGKRVLRTGLVPEPLEFSNHDSITDTIESVVHMARAQPKQPLSQAGKRWTKSEEEAQAKRPRRCQGSKMEEAGLSRRKPGSLGHFLANY